MSKEFGYINTLCQAILNNDSATAKAAISGLDGLTSGNVAKDTLPPLRGLAEQLGHHACSFHFPTVALPFDFTILLEISIQYQCHILIEFLESFNTPLFIEIFPRVFNRTAFEPKQLELLTSISASARKAFFASSYAFQKNAIDENTIASIECSEIMFTLNIVPLLRPFLTQHITPKLSLTGPLDDIEFDISLKIHLHDHQSDISFHIIKHQLENAASHADLLATARVINQHLRGYIHLLEANTEFVEAIFTLIDNTLAQYRIIITQHEALTRELIATNELFISYNNIPTPLALPTTNTILSQLSLEGKITLLNGFLHCSHCLQINRLIADDLRMQLEKLSFLKKQKAVRQIRGTLEILNNQSRSNQNKQNNLINFTLVANILSQKTLFKIYNINPKKWEDSLIALYQKTGGGAAAYHYFMTLAPLNAIGSKNTYHDSFTLDIAVRRFDINSILTQSDNDGELVKYALKQLSCA